MPHKRVRNGTHTKEKIVELYWNTFINYSGKTHRDRTFDGLGMIMEKTDVKCQVNFTQEHKGICDYIGERSYLVKFRSRSAFKIELAYALLLYEQAFSLYNKKANETYRMWTLSTYAPKKSESGDVSDIGDSESDSEDMEEFWEEKCEICGTTKGSDYPFEVTKCRNLDKSIVDNLINKMRQRIQKTYENFKEGDKKHNKKEFNSMIEMFITFMEKFIKWSKFCFSHQLPLKYLFRYLTRTKYLKNYTYEQVTTVNYIIQEFINRMVMARLPKTI